MSASFFSNCSVRLVIRLCAGRRQLYKAMIAIETIEDFQDAVDGGEVAVIGLFDQPDQHRFETPDLQLGVVPRGPNRDRLQLGAQILSTRARVIPGVAML